MEPVNGVEKIPRQRWKLVRTYLLQVCLQLLTHLQRCSICNVRTGACIQCTKASCFSAFHATCARKEKLLMPMKATQGSEAPTLACYCEKHLPVRTPANHSTTVLTSCSANKPRPALRRNAPNRHARRPPTPPPTPTPTRRRARPRARTPRRTNLARRSCRASSSTAS